MKLVFLDIDGVLNYQGSQIIDEGCLNNLKRIISETKARIVLISSWKHFFDDEIMYNLRNFNNQKQLDEFIYYRGILNDIFTGDMELLGLSPDLGEHRSEEIALWLKEHSDLNIESFVIIDDFNCDYDKNYPNNWVRPSWFMVGLSENLTNCAINILNKK